MASPPIDSKDAGSMSTSPHSTPGPPPYTEASSLPPTYEQPNAATKNNASESTQRTTLSGANTALHQLHPMDLGRLENQIWDLIDRRRREKLDAQAKSDSDVKMARFHWAWFGPTLIVLLVIGLILNRNTSSYPELFDFAGIFLAVFWAGSVMKFIHWVPMLTGGESSKPLAVGWIFGLLVTGEAMVWYVFGSW